MRSASLIFDPPNRLLEVSAEPTSEVWPMTSFHEAVRVLVSCPLFVQFSRRFNLGL